MFYYKLIIFDQVSVKSFDNKEYVLSFQIPLGKTTIIILPSSIDKKEIAKLIAGLSKPEKGSVIHEFGETSIKPTIYIPEQLPDELDLVSIVKKLKPELCGEIIRIIKSIGYDLYVDKTISETPDYVIKIFLILYALYSADKLSILIEPFIGLDHRLLSLLSIEFRKLNSNNLTIVILTNNSEFLKTSIEIYDYAIVVESETNIVTGDRNRFVSKKILEGLEVYEVLGRRNIINHLVDIEGFNGYLKIDQNKYLLFIDSRFKWVFLKKINELYKNRSILHYRYLNRESIGL